MRANSKTLAVLGLLTTSTALVGCDQPDPLVICHNSNCAEPTDVRRDDTLEGLRASLALEYNGRPVLDGMEMDSFWRASDDKCLYAHDLETVNTDVPATAPATELAAYFAQPGPIGFRDDRPYEVLLELKPVTSPPPFLRHTPEQFIAHAKCSWDIYNIVSAAAVANNRDIRVIFSSFSPKLLQAVIDTKPALTPVAYEFEALQGIPKPLDGETPPLSAFNGLPIDTVEFHNNWITDAQHEAFLSMHAKLSLFMFDATAETFAAIRQYEPDAVVTSEARLMRRWLSR